MDATGDGGGSSWPCAAGTTTPAATAGGTNGRDADVETDVEATDGWLRSGVCTKLAGVVVADDDDGVLCAQDMAGDAFATGRYWDAMHASSAKVVVNGLMVVTLRV